jgi:uncharacterized protein
VTIGPRTIARAAAIARDTFAGERGSHDWDHTLRVHDLCLAIARREGGGREVIRLSAYLHDIGRTRRFGRGNGGHAVRGARAARTILSGLRVDPSVIDRVVHCIATHRFRGDAQPETIEAKVLFDADKLDSIGAIGIGRAFVFAGENGAKVHNLPGVAVEKTEALSVEDTAYREYLVKLRHVKGRLFTREGRRLARQRHRFMEAFFAQIEAEVRGRS